VKPKQSLGTSGKRHQPSKKQTPATIPDATPSGHRKSTSEDLHVRIEKRAYELYERRMRKGALDDWLEAEREILSHEPSL
jgi:hypothetical protein